MTTEQDCQHCPLMHKNVIHRDNLMAEVQPIIKQTVVETLTALGADLENPLQMQQDFAYVRRIRTRRQHVENGFVTKVLVTGTMFILAAAMAWFNLGMPR